MPRSTIHNTPKENQSVIDLFHYQVSQTPENIAVCFEGSAITYTELNNITNQFAHYLIETYKIKKGDCIGLMLERSEWLVIGMLSILKAGAAYVPIAPDFPEQRKTFIEKDSQCKFVLKAETVENFKSYNELENTQRLDLSISGSDLMYILYTSGTTGNPKGVMVEHNSVINLINYLTKRYGIDENERILQFTNYFFDASVEQFFLSLLSGSTLYIISKDQLLHHELPLFIEENNITHLHATPSYLDTLPEISHLNSLKRIVAGGEVCSLKLAEKLGSICDFYNKYGPTEATVTTTIHKYSVDDIETNSLSIGKPIDNVEVYILTDDLAPLPPGEIGELCITGAGLSRGYLNLPEVTSEKFITNPFDSTSKLYRSGDFARLREDGTIEYMGRQDDQVKIRGYRIELGEIESVLNKIPNVKRAVAISKEHDELEKRLVAYIQFTDEVVEHDIIRQQLSKTLPGYMIPNIMVDVEHFHLTPNGKIDKNKLPEPINKRPSSAPILRKPRSNAEKKIASVYSELLGFSEIGIDDNFFEMGGTSLLSQRAAALIGSKLGIALSVTRIYQYPTVAELANFLDIDKNINIAALPKKNNKQTSGDIAVIGMALKFPGANTVEEFWKILENGEQTISFFSNEELDSSIPEEIKNDPLYVPARGIIPSAKEFDAQFFGMNPKMAKTMDPQQRLFLEVAWEVLEKSGYLPKHYQGGVGVYAGCGANTYYPNNVIPHKDLINQVGSFLVNILNDKGYVATRTAYHLNLKGPAVSVHSACSTSLLAIAQAVEAIRSGQCAVAIAGGSSVTAPIYSGHLYQEGSMLSNDGTCRPFDQNAKGTLFCDGAGAVLLKNMEQAIEDGDTIHGVIKGVGINNDGGEKGSFTAPSIEGQAGAIAMALSDSGISPSNISYIEAHGTATPLGDPIEIEGLKTAFGEQEKTEYCAIGSVKSNMGHLTAAAGVAGFIKTILALKNKKIPASLGFEKANPAIDFSASPFFVNSRLRDWDVNKTRRAGISSFGVGGTNVHVVVEEFIDKSKPVNYSKSRPVSILNWSAKSEKSNSAYKTALGDFIQNNKKSNLNAIGYSLTATRDVFSERSFVVAKDTKEAVAKLLSNDSAVATSNLKVIPSNLAFLFPGQGAQYLQMGKALYDQEEVFRTAVDTCAKILTDELELDILEIIYPDHNSTEAEQRLKDTQFTQPALFIIEYALAQLWLSWGVKPTLLCGHSIGEFVAAHLAGVFTLKDALLLVAFRGKIISELPGGSMLSVRLNSAELKPLLPNSLSIAAINSDMLTVVSGEDHEIEKFSQVLEDKGIVNKVLQTSHAFHSKMMNPALSAFEEKVGSLHLNVPRVPIVSTVTGHWMHDDEATSPKYWANHLREAVNFSGAMETILKQEDVILLEVGPGRALSTLSKQKKDYKTLASISCLTYPKETENAYHTILTALGELWLKGIEIDWNAFYKDHNKTLIELPSYRFDRKPCWIEPALETSSKSNLEIINTLSTIENDIRSEFTPVVNAPNSNSHDMRKPLILNKIAEIIEDNSGIEIESSQFGLNFLELGLDSLVLTQMAINIKNEFNTPITFRQLNDNLNSPELLAVHLDTVLPMDAYQPAVNENIDQINASTLVTNSTQQDTMGPTNSSDSNSALNIIAQQLQELGKQVELLKGNNTSVAADKTKGPAYQTTPINNTDSEGLTEAEKKEHSKPFGASPKIEKQSNDLNEKQQSFLTALTERYNNKTANSKSYTQKHRHHMSDPRVVSGFKPLTKEMVYPIVVKKSKGNRLWDLDGNEYLDALNGFGSCFFGHQPDFIKEALHDQIESGFEIGPQHPLAGEVCELLCEFTGHERAALCNTGSEAVLGAMRIARTVTGRSLIVAFSRAYHGINDEVIIRGSKKLKTFPAAAGIMPEAVKNMLVLDYGTQESLEIIRERAHELAGVIVEPVQSRRPDFQPIEFLKELRTITKESDTTLIFDEIITGFRTHPGGAQALFGIKADVATYGKVIGGGMSIGAICGNKKSMDALDGGYWEFGDNSYPEAGVTYFAGTFVRHPLALASSKASLLYMKEKGIELQNRLANMATRLAREINSELRQKNLPMEIVHFSSLWRLKFLEDIPYSELFFVLMREKGIHIWDGFPCYITDAYTDDDITHLIQVFIECIDDLINASILPDLTTMNGQQNGTKSLTAALNTPPILGAKLGIDEEGNPAWYAKDDKDDEYIKIEL